MKRRTAPDRSPLCTCGCGEMIKLGSRFIRGHHMKTSEHKDRQSIQRSGKNHPFYGKKRSGHSEKMTIRMAGKNNPMYGKKRPDHGKIMSAIMLTDRNPMKDPEVKVKHLNILRSPEYREMMSVKKSGDNNHMKLPKYRKWFSDNNPMKRPEVAIKFLGSNNPNWKGGITAEPYCDVWIDQEYKQSIRERDNNECQNPDCWDNCNHLYLGLHHIDYVKKNCDPWNLITLCCSCNFRANYDRKYWQEFYQNIIVDKESIVDKERKVACA